MSDLIDRQTAIDALIERDPSGLDSVLNIIRGLPSAQPEVTEEDVIEYCQKRCLCIVDSALFKKYEFAQPEQWIPCSERLPETTGRYLVTRGSKSRYAIWNRVYIINYSDLMGLKSEKIWWDGHVGESDFQKIDDVIAWKPLPKSYKGETETNTKVYDPVDLVKDLSDKIDIDQLYAIVLDMYGKGALIDSETRKKGKWKRAYLDHETMGERPSILYCSICNQCTTYPTNYCPHCGADMIDN